jgi:copper chaperone CopZ
MERYELNVAGMVCSGCERIIEDEIAGLPGVSTVDADNHENVVTVEGEAVAADAVRRTITDAGYTPRNSVD